MAEFAKEILPINIEEEMKHSYMDYAMSVIIGRALPDVRDGMKPVHRRAIYAMHEAGMDFNKPYKKSARIVGEVLGKYHPHGDSAVYDTIVRMAQDFSLRYPLIDGQGNFGSIDGDSPAAMRYTEVRMAKISHELLADIEKETVDFVPNYDESEHEPEVLPTRIPNLLVNGSSGIAVGMATNIPPHNLSEVVKGCLAYIDNTEISIDELIEYIPGPDFPTAGIINGSKGIIEAYRTGRGRVQVRAKADIEEMDNGRERIVVTELPYQVNKARLLERIAELVREKKIEGISELRDESDKEGMRMVIELKRGENADVVLNTLYKHTALQNVFGINMVALVDGQPRILNLKETIEAFVRHRREVVHRRTVFELRKARDRAHVLEGLAVALANIDPLIQLIKESPSPAEAKERILAQNWSAGFVLKLLEAADAEISRPDNLDKAFGIQGDEYRLSPTQAQAILDLRLHRLTGLEQEKIIDEYKGLLEQIRGYLEILGDFNVLMQVIRDELAVILENYGDERRTEIRVSQEDLSLEDLISEEDVVVTLSHEGYVKSQPLSDYTAQRRGGRGKSATSMKEEDFIDKLFVASTHDTILCFSSRGRVYWLKVYQIPQASRGSRGRPIVNLLPLEGDERISAVQPVREFEEGHFVFFATANGTVKKTPLVDFSRPRSSGIIAVDLRDGDSLVDVNITDGEKHVMLFSSTGKAIRFQESDVRAMGRTAAGVRGIKLQEGQQVVSMQTVQSEESELTVLLATENGYGKRTLVSDFPQYGRGGQGVIGIQTSERNGQLIGAALVGDNNEAMLISNGGTLVRTRVSEISVLGRNTQGVKLINLTNGEKLVALEPVAESEETDAELEDVEQANIDSAKQRNDAANDSDTSDDDETDDDAGE